MNFSVLIVDDEPLARLGVRSRLRLHPDMHVIGECGSGSDAIEMIRAKTPDLVFLDIQMPGLSGLDALRSLPKFSFPRVVFLTAHQEYALEAFQVHALDYLLKPVDDERFLECLDRVRRILPLHKGDTVPKDASDKNSPDGYRTAGLIARFAIRTGNNILFIRAEEVDWFEALGDYTGLHVGERTHLLREQIGALEKRLDREHFLRVHRSAIIQIERIMRVKALSNRDCLVTLRNGNTVRASRTFSPQLQQILKNEV